MRYEPFPQRADRAVADRLGQIVETGPGRWMVVDDHHDHHAISSETHQPLDPPAASCGRWVVIGPVPTYALGESLLIAWRLRNGSPPRKQRENRRATVEEESGELIAVRDELGEVHRLYRVHGGAVVDLEGARDEPRWRVIQRGDGSLPIFTAPSRPQH
jgi:hypothetical protein